jgi:hypothetical protein
MRSWLFPVLLGLVVMCAGILLIVFRVNYAAYQDRRHQWWRELLGIRTKSDPDDFAYSGGCLALVGLVVLVLGIGLAVGR